MAARSVRRDVVDAAGAPLRVGGHAKDAAIGTDLEIAGGERGRDEGEVDGRFGADVAAVKCIVAAISAGRTAVMRDGIDAGGNGVRVVAERAAGLAEEFAYAGSAERGKRIILAAVALEGI